MFSEKSSDREMIFLPALEEFCAAPLRPALSGRCAAKKLGWQAATEEHCVSACHPLIWLHGNYRLNAVRKSSFRLRDWERKGKKCVCVWLSSLMNMSDVFKQMDYHICTHSAGSGLLQKHLPVCTGINENNVYWRYVGNIIPLAFSAHEGNQTCVSQSILSVNSLALDLTSMWHMTSCPSENF